MKYKLAVIIERNMNFGQTSQGVSFYDTIEEAIEKVTTGNILFAFPAEIAEKMLKWVEDITKVLPEGIGCIKDTYMPVMCKDYDLKKWPVVDGVEATLHLGKFSMITNNPFTGSVLVKSFTKSTEANSPKEKKITWRNIK